MKIYLIRHGQSTSDVKERYDGDYDDHLTGEGKETADQIANKLAASSIEAIFCSSKIRAKETSEILQQKWNCAIRINSGLNERDIYGAFPDLKVNQPEEEYRRLGEINNDKEKMLDGVESYSDFSTRVKSSFEEILDSDYGTIVLITHGGPIRTIFRDVLGLGELKKIGNGAIIEIEKHDSSFNVVEMEGAALN